MCQCTCETNLGLWFLCLGPPYSKNKQKEELEKVQKNAARFITNNYDYTPGSTSMNMQRLGWIPLEEHRARIKSTAFYKACIT